MFELSLKLFKLEGYSSEVISKILICLFEALIGGLKLGEELTVSIPQAVLLGLQIKLELRVFSCLSC